MNMDIDQKPDLTKVNAAVTVSDTMSMLREAFMPLDFKKVEESLASRERTKAEEVAHWKREYEVMEKRHGEAKLGLILVKEELSKSERKVGELADQVARLEEERRLDHQNEILVARERRLNEEIDRLKREYEAQEKKLRDEMKARLSIDEELSKCKRELGGLKDSVTWLEDEKKLIIAKIKVSDEREIKARDSYKKLLDDFEAVRRENRDLLVRNTESELARVKAERELESCEKKNEEVDLRLTKLEEEYEALVNQLLQKSKVEEGKDSTNVTSALKSPVGTKSGNPSKPQVNEVISDGKEKHSSSVGANGVNNMVNWIKEEADADIVIPPCNEGIPIANQTVVERGGSSRRDSQKEKRQKIGLVDGKTESAVIVISDSDSDGEMPTQRHKEETKSKTSEQVAGRNQSSSGCKRNRLPLDWSSVSTDSDYDTDDDSCGSVAMENVAKCQ